MNITIVSEGNIIKASYPAGSTMRDIRSSIKNAKLQNELFEVSSLYTSDKKTYFVNPTEISWIIVDEAVIEPQRAIEPVVEQKAIQVGTFTGTTADNFVKEDKKKK